MRPSKLLVFFCLLFLSLHSFAKLKSRNLKWYQLATYRRLQKTTGTFGSSVIFTKGLNGTSVVQAVNLISNGLPASSPERVNRFRVVVNSSPAGSVSISPDCLTSGPYLQQFWPKVPIVFPAPTGAVPATTGPHVIVAPPAPSVFYCTKGVDCVVEIFGQDLQTGTVNSGIVDYAALFTTSLATAAASSQFTTSTATHPAYGATQFSVLDLASDQSNCGNRDKLATYSSATAANLFFPATAPGNNAFSDSNVGLLGQNVGVADGQTEAFTISGTYSGSAVTVTTSPVAFILCWLDGRFANATGTPPTNLAASMFTTPAAIVIFTTPFSNVPPVGNANLLPAAYSLQAVPPAAGNVANRVFPRQEWYCIKGNDCIISIPTNSIATEAKAINLRLVDISGANLVSSLESANGGCQAVVPGGTDVSYLGGSAVSPSAGSPGDLPVSASSNAYTITLSATVTAWAPKTASADAVIAVCLKGGTAASPDYSFAVGHLFWTSSFASQGTVLSTAVKGDGTTAGNAVWNVAWVSAVAPSGSVLSPALYSYDLWYNQYPKNFVGLPNLVSGGLPAQPWVFKAANPQNIYGYTAGGTQANPTVIAGSPVVFCNVWGCTITLQGGNGITAAGGDKVLLYDALKEGDNKCGGSTPTGVSGLSWAWVGTLAAQPTPGVATFTPAASGSGTAIVFTASSVTMAAGSVYQGGDWRICVAPAGSTTINQYRQVAYLVWTAVAPITPFGNTWPSVPAATSTATNVIYWRGMTAPSAFTITKAPSTSFNLAATGSTLAGADAAMLKSGPSCISGAPVANSVVYATSTTNGGFDLYAKIIAQSNAPVLTSGVMYNICFQDNFAAAGGTTPTATAFQANFFVQVGFLTYYAFPRPAIDYYPQTYDSTAGSPTVGTWKPPTTVTSCIKGAFCTVNLAVPFAAYTFAAVTTDKGAGDYVYVAPFYKNDGTGGFTSCGSGTAFGDIYAVKLNATISTYYVTISNATTGGTGGMTVGPMTYQLCIQQAVASFASGTAPTYGASFNFAVALINVIDAAGSVCQWTDMNANPYMTLARTPARIRDNMIAYLNGTATNKPTGTLLDPANVTYDLGATTTGPAATTTTKKASSAVRVEAKMSALVSALLSLLLALLPVLARHD